ncbi:MAG: hypothetical protein Q7T05_04035 [Dehalococcoidia bacterium]|nr:hypothetical protein [Dehalococcoidia bacterium]
MSVYQTVGIVLVALPVAIGFIGFLTRWPKLAPQPVEAHGKVWGRRCPRCQSDEFAPVGEGYQKCTNCGHTFI